MSWEWIVLPLIGSAIGWLTNLVAIRMLFRPKTPVRIGSLFVFQGVLPRRQEDLARVVAETVERDLLPIDELVESIDVSGYQTDVVDAVIHYVDRRLDEQLPQTLPSQIKRMVSRYVRRIVAREAAHVVQDASDRIRERITSEVRLGDVVREKVSSLDTDDLEKIVVQVARTELRAIEVLGAALGFMIGVLQAALVNWL